MEFNLSSLQNLASLRISETRAALKSAKYTQNVNITFLIDLEPSIRFRAENEIYDLIYYLNAAAIPICKYRLQPYDSVIAFYGSQYKETILYLYIYIFSSSAYTCNHKTYIYIYTYILTFMGPSPGINRAPIARMKMILIPIESLYKNLQV